MEDVHFRRAYFTPEDVGWKALAVNLSDLAACGARPVGFTVGLALPADADMELVDSLCAGMAEVAGAVPLVGGDLSRAERLHLCVTVFGQAEKTLLRGVAEPGDMIFMTGRAGLARTGLGLLEQYGRAARADWPDACNAHLRPVPRLRDGMRLSTLAAMTGTADRPDRIGLMDLSDGLARDLPRLVGKGRGADISLPKPHQEITRLMASRCGTGLCQREGLSATTRQMFLGGEEYGLIGTCAPDLASQVMVTLAEATVLGKVTDGEGILVGGVRAGSGFDHFSA